MNQPTGANPQKLLTRGIIYGAVIGAVLGLWIDFLGFWGGLILGAIVGGVLIWWIGSRSRT